MVVMISLIVGASLDSNGQTAVGVAACALWCEFVAVDRVWAANFSSNKAG
mgnify:CR=1 FL=1